MEFHHGGVAGSGYFTESGQRSIEPVLDDDLELDGGAGATSHDVRFGTANPPPFIQNQAGTTYNPGTLAGSTTYYWRIDEKNAAGTTTGTVWSFSTASQSPYGGTARTIPGTIQAEDYDLGAEGAAYHDTTAGNFMGGYRSNDVDIEGCGDTGGGFNVGFLAAGEWLEYTVNITNTGDHTFKVRLASGASGGTFNFSLNGNFITGNKTVAATGGWQTYTTITVPSVYMAAGNNQILRFNMPTDGMNINKIDVGYGGADAVHVDLDTTVLEDGMTHPVCCDGMTTVRPSADTMAVRTSAIPLTVICTSRSSTSTPSRAIGRMSGSPSSTMTAARPR